MAFDSEKWDKPVIGGDAGGLALSTSLALRKINEALQKLSEATGVDISSELESIEASRKDLFEAFEDLTGWKVGDER